MKKFLIIIISLLLLFLLGYSSFRYLKSSLVRRLERTFHAKVSYERLGLNPFKGIEASGLRIGDFFEVDTVILGFSLGGVLSGRIESFYLKGISFDVDKYREKATARGAEPSGSKPEGKEGRFPSPPKIEIRDLSLSGIKVSVGNSLFTAESLSGILLGKSVVPSYSFQLKEANLGGIVIEEGNLELLHRRAWEIKTLSFSGPEVNLDLLVGVLSYPEMRIQAYGMGWKDRFNLREANLLWNIEDSLFELGLVSSSILGRSLDTLRVEGLLNLGTYGGYLTIDHYNLKAREGHLVGSGWLRRFLQGPEKARFELSFWTDSLTISDEPVKGLFFRGGGKFSGSFLFPRVDLDLQDVSFLGYKVPRLSGQLSYAPGKIRFQDVLISDSSYYALLKGSYGKGGLVMDFQGGIKDFSTLPIGTVEGLKGEFDFSGRIGLTEGKEEIDAVLVGKALSLSPINAQKLKARFRGWGQGELSLSLYRGKCAGIPFDSISVVTEWGKKKKLPYTLYASLDEERKILLKGTWKEERGITIETSTLSLYERDDSIRIESPLRFSRGKEWTSLNWENVDIFGGRIEYLIGALSTLKNEVDLRLKVSDLDLGRVRKFFGIEDSLAGTMNLFAKITGRADSPQVSLRSHIKNPRIGNFEGEVFVVEARYEEHNFHLDTLILYSYGVPAAGYLEFPLEFSLNPFLLKPLVDSLKGSFSSPGIDVSLLNKMSAGFLTMEGGTLKAGINLSGTPENPVLLGEFSLYSREALLEPLNLELVNVEAKGKLQGDSINLISVKAISRKGSIEGKGVVLLSKFNPKWMNLKFNLKRLYLNPDPNSEATVSGRFTITGPPDSIYILGNAHIDEALLYLPFGKRKAGTAPGPSPLRYSIKVNAEKGVFVMNELLNLELKGNLDIKKEDEIHTTISGRLEVVSGTFLYADRVFTLTEGRVEFQGQPRVNPILDIEGNTLIEDTILVTLHLTGTVEKPEITLSSKPPLAQEDIIAYLTFGKPLSEIPLSLTDLDLLRERALNLAEGLLSLQLRRKLRVSELELETGLLGGDPHFTVGFYLSRNLYLKYSFDPQSLEKNVFLTKYFFTRRAALYAQRDREGEFAAGLEILFRF